jgi:hypothetical protein
MKNILLKSATLLFLMVSVAFADDTIFNVINSKLVAILGYVLAILGAVISLKLIVLPWFHVKKVLLRDGKINSTPESRRIARDRLSSSKNKSSRSISDGGSNESSNFRKKFSSYEDFQGSKDSLFNK